MLPAHYDMGVLMAWIHAVLAPVHWVWWRLELMFRVQFRLSGDLVPTAPLELDVFTGGPIVTYEMRDQLRHGEIAAVKGLCRCQGPA